MPFYISKIQIEICSEILYVSKYKGISININISEMLTLMLKFKNIF